MVNLKHKLHKSPKIALSTNMFEQNVSQKVQKKVQKSRDIAYWTAPIACAITRELGPKPSNHYLYKTSRVVVVVGCLLLLSPSIIDEIKP